MTSELPLMEMVTVTWSLAATFLERGKERGKRKKGAKGKKGVLLFVRVGFWGRDYVVLIIPL